MRKERIPEAVELVRKQKAMPSETERAAKTHIELIGYERPVGNKSSGKLAAQHLPKLSIEGHAPPWTRQHRDLAVDKGGARQRWQFRTAIAGSLFKL